MSIVPKMWRKFARRPRFTERKFTIPQRLVIESDHHTEDMVLFACFVKEKKSLRGRCGRILLRVIVHFEEMNDLYVTDPEDIACILAEYWIPSPGIKSITLILWNPEKGGGVEAIELVQMSLFCIWTQ